MSWEPEQLSGNSRRGRQLVFLSSAGLHPTSLSSNDSVNIEAALQRIDLSEEEVQVVPLSASIVSLKIFFGCCRLEQLHFEAYRRILMNASAV